MSARKKNSLNRQARRAYSQDALARICTLPEQDFGRAFKMETVEVEQPGRKWWRREQPASDYYHFRDNGARVLAVAHLDTVVPGERRAPHFRATQTGPLIVSGALDDRLGAYVILDLLPKLGVTCDWLLTTGEESCQSTAKFFSPGEKKYDWAIEFDRAGTDVVMYQYEDGASRRAVRASGAVTGQGSFSDIAALEHLGVKAFNWGVGYRGNYHSERGYAYLYDTFAMTAKYLRFHAQNAGTAMPHKPSRTDWWDDDLYDDDETKTVTSYRVGTADFIDCDSCGALQAVDPDTLICAYCDACLNCKEESLTCTCPGGPGVWTVNRDGTPARLPLLATKMQGADNESDDECRHDNYTTCGCDNGLQQAARDSEAVTTV